MNDNPELGEGWRPVAAAEIIQEGDQFYSCGFWRNTGNVGQRAQTGSYYRRRIVNGGWIKTSERLPTKEDSINGTVLVFNGSFTAVVPLSSVGYYTHWIRHPRPPALEQSDEDKAFEEWIAEYPSQEVLTSWWTGVLKSCWDARGEWEHKRKA